MKQDSRPYPAAPQCFKVFIYQLYQLLYLQIEENISPSGIQREIHRLLLMKRDSDIPSFFFFQALKKRPGFSKILHVKADSLC